MPGSAPTPREAKIEVLRWRWMTLRTVARNLSFAVKVGWIGGVVGFVAMEGDLRSRGAGIAVVVIGVGTI